MRRLYSKWISMIVAFCIIATIFPILPMTANAASTPGVPSFFYPSDPNLLATANKDPIADGLATFAQKVSTGTLTITGTYQSVSADSIKVKIESLVSNGSNSWKVDKSSTKPANTSGLTFELPSIQLFSGYNRITISGSLNGDSKEDAFYVYYDDAPYLKNLKVIAPGSLDPIDLNEGTVRVISKPVSDPDYRMFIYLQGLAANAQGITINNTVVQTAEDGSFITPQIELKPGENTINFTINNGSDSIGVTRKIYYYDQNSPYLDVQMTHVFTSGTEGPFSLKSSTVPSFTGGTPNVASTGNLAISLLVPYNTSSSLVDFLSYATVTASIYNSTTTQTLTKDTTNSSNEEKIIYDSKGNPEFLALKFITTGLNIPASANGLQKVSLNVNYTNGSKVYAAITDGLAFYLYRGNTVVTKVELMETKIDGTYGGSLGDLNNKEVMASEFFIKVTADKSIAKSLEATLLPLGTTALTVTEAGTISANEKVYKVSGLPAGTQQVQLWFTGSESKFVASVNYVTKVYIQVDGVYDQQVLNVDSNNPTATSATAIMSFKGFTTIDDPVYILNGTTSIINFTTPSSYSLTMTVGNANPNQSLLYGENTLTVRGYNEIGQDRVLVEKVIHLYVIDSNQPGFVQLKPLDPIAAGGTAPSITDALNSALKQIYYDKNTDKYSTKAKEYGLIFQGSGANTATVSRNGEVVAVFAVNDSGVALSSGSGIGWDYFGNSKSFIIRIRGLTISSTNSDVYSVELKNSTGARVTRKLEIARELADIVYWSPVPTVGDRVVVNKNFVLFDIEAEGAISVLVDGKTATPRSDLKDRFTYTYMGLKVNKETKVKVTVNRASGAKTETVTVFYTGTVQVGSQFMEKLNSKHSMFGGNLELTFPKGIVLKTANPGTLETVKYYDRTNLLFGIADPSDGVVERVNDYGQMIGYVNHLDNKGPVVYVDPSMKALYTNNVQTQKFTAISPVYWISGGLGESSAASVSGQKPATDGIQPYLENGGFAQNVRYGGSRKVIPANRGTLTLKFDDNLVSEAGTIVSVFRMNDSGVWTNVGGAVNTKDNTITVNFDDFGYYKVMKLRESFYDVTNHAWARNTIDALFAKGVMRRMNYDQFGVDNYITRGEFAALMVRALDLPINSDANYTFYDVQNTGFLDMYGPQELWKYSEIETAARAGIVTGVEQRFFDVNGRIKRQDAAVMIARAMELKLPANDSPTSSTKKLLTTLEKLFTDGTSIDYYARPSVSAVNSNGIMEGKPNALVEGEKKATVSFVPTANLTRAEAAVIVLRIMKKKTKVFPASFS